MVYSAKGYLATTQMIQMYHRWGMQITNLSWALEYQSGFPLRSFLEKVTQERVKATQDGDNVRGNLFKLCANSSYGRLGNILMFACFYPS